MIYFDLFVSMVTGNSLSSVYQRDISTLGGGPHIFILCVDDGFGKTLMKIRPFVIGTGRCGLYVGVYGVTLPLSHNSYPTMLSSYQLHSVLSEHLSAPATTIVTLCTPWQLLPHRGIQVYTFYKCVCVQRL